MFGCSTVKFLICDLSGKNQWTTYVVHELIAGLLYGVIYGAYPFKFFLIYFH
jgi:hypothetical protein